VAAFEQLNLGQLAEFGLDPADGAQPLLDYLCRKTAALFKASCVVGAFCGGASAAQTRDLAEFGWHFGMLFQMVDDLLDVVGDETRLGKPVHQDLRNGIFTMPALHALTVDRAELMRAVDDEDFDAAYEIVGNDASVRHAIGVAEGHARSAVACLDAALGDRVPAWLGEYVGGYLARALRETGTGTTEDW
jgi:geranylgeranyl pyrophosphate synthase